MVIYIAWAIVLLLLAYVIGTAIFFLTKGRRSLKNYFNKATLKYIVISVLCVIIAALAWIFNFGIIRDTINLFALPVIHSIVFLIVIFFSLAYINDSSMLKKLFALCCVTYLLAFLILPDENITLHSGNEFYLFFGLLRFKYDGSIDGRAVSKLLGLSVIVLLVNIGAMICQVIEILRLKKEKKNALSTPAEIHDSASESL